MRIAPKSGRPVFGQSDVNSGQSMAISYSRSGRGFGNVSSVELDIDRNSSIPRRKTAVSRRDAIDTGESRALGYGGFPRESAIACCARGDRRLNITRVK